VIIISLGVGCWFLVVGFKEVCCFFHQLSSLFSSFFEFSKAIDEMLFELMKSSGTAKDLAENELKKRRKKRR
jgi:hypothetical protein